MLTHASVSVFSGIQLQRIYSRRTPSIRLLRSGISTRTDVMRLKWHSLICLTPVPLFVGALTVRCSAEWLRTSQWSFLTLDRRHLLLRLNLTLDLVNNVWSGLMTRPSLHQDSINKLRDNGVPGISEIWHSHLSWVHSRKDQVFPSSSMIENTRS